MNLFIKSFGYSFGIVCGFGLSFTILSVGDRVWNFVREEYYRWREGRYVRRPKAG